MNRQIAQIEQIIRDGISDTSIEDYPEKLSRIVKSVKDHHGLTKADIEHLRVFLLQTFARVGLSAIDTDQLIAIEFDLHFEEPQYKILSAHDILTRNYTPPKWIIPEILPIGLSSLAGRPKIGKSWLGLQFANAVSHGGNVFDNRVEQAQVLYLASEDPEWRLKERMTIQHWDINNGHCHFMTLGTFRDVIGDLSGEGGQKLANLINENRYRLVVIDTLSRTFSGDQNDVNAMTEALSPIQRAAFELDAAILVIDHHHKFLSTEKDPVFDMLGSTAKGAVFNTALGLYREHGKPHAELKICGHDVVETTIDLEMDWSIGTWQKVAEGEGNLPEGQDIIVSALEECGEIGLRDLCEAVGKDYRKDRGTIHKSLQELINKGKVERRNGSGRIRYALIPLPPHTTIQHTQQHNTDNNATIQQDLDEVPF